MRFDSSFRMLSVPKNKYKEVTINLTQQPENLGNGRIRHGFNYPIAKIELHDGTFGSASKVFEDSTRLAEQIAKRWNEHPLLSSENAQLREALRELVEKINMLTYSIVEEEREVNNDFFAETMDSLAKAKTLLNKNDEKDRI